MLFFSDDPVLDEERYTRALDMKLARRPKCSNCGHHIQDDEALHFIKKNVEIWLCLDCLDEKMELLED